MGAVQKSQTTSACHSGAALDGRRCQPAPNLWFQSLIKLNDAIISPQKTAIAFEPGEDKRYSRL
jgi:hypothetical protein